MVRFRQVDLRRVNSWLLKLDQVSTGEAAEVMAINALAPFILNGKLRGLMERSPPLAVDPPTQVASQKQAAKAASEGKGDSTTPSSPQAVPKFIVNVSAMEGKFYRFKTANHPHTNMAKARRPTSLPFAGDAGYKCTSF